MDWRSCKKFREFSRDLVAVRRPVGVHGYAVGHYAWRHVLPRFVEAGHEVIAPDLPGCGESDRPSPRAYAYDGPALLGTLTGFLDALGLERVSLVCHSMGGTIGLMLAARHPERVERLVLSDPVVYPFELPVE